MEVSFSDPVCLFCHKELFTQNDHLLLDCLHYCCHECEQKRHVGLNGTKRRASDFDKKIFCQACRCFSWYYEASDLRDNIDSLRFQSTYHKKKLEAKMKEKSQTERNEEGSSGIPSEQGSVVREIEKESSNDLPDAEDTRGRDPQREREENYVERQSIATETCEMFVSPFPIRKVCLHHPDQFVSMLCINDSELICPECTPDHKFHLKATIKEALPRIRLYNDEAKREVSSILNMCDNCIAQVNSNVSQLLEKKNSALAEVTKRFDDMRRQLVSRETQLKKEVEEFVLRKVSSLQASLDYMSEVRFMFEMVLGFDKNEDLLNTLELHEYFTRVRKNFTPSFKIDPLPKTLSFIDFGKWEENFQAVAKGIGTLLIADASEIISATNRCNGMKMNTENRENLRQLVSTFKSFKTSQYFARGKSFRGPDSSRMEEARASFGSGKGKVRVRNISSSFKRTNPQNQSSFG